MSMLKGNLLGHIIRAKSNHLQLSRKQTVIGDSNGAFNGNTGFNRLKSFWGFSPFDHFVKGDVVDHIIDLKTFRPGDTVSAAYEITMSKGHTTFWQSAICSFDKINISSPFARSLGFQEQIVPFHLMLFFAGTIDSAQLQTNFRNAIYHWPAFAEDTISKRCILRSLRTNCDQTHSIFTVHCQLINQRDLVVFSCDKIMLYPMVVNCFRSEVSLESVERIGDEKNALLKQLIYAIKNNTSYTVSFSPHVASLIPGQLVLHRLRRTLTTTQSMQLASLARLTHESYYNTRLLCDSEQQKTDGYHRLEGGLTVPGELVLGLTCSLSSKDLMETLHEELIECSFPNPLHTDDSVGAITYVKEVEKDVSEEIEAIIVRTVGIKNYNVHPSLIGKELPLELFTTPLHQLRPTAVESLLVQHHHHYISSVPYQPPAAKELSNRIVCIADRVLYRYKPSLL